MRSTWTTSWLAMMARADLNVFIEGRLVGVVDGANPSSLRFRYDDRWAADPDSTPLSVSMPLAVEDHTHRVVHSFLWGLLPDNDRVLARWASDFQCSATDVIALLSNVGAEVAGAAQYLPIGEDPDEAGPGAVVALTEADVAQRLRAVRRDTTAWHAARTSGRWSLAGAQGKIVLHRDADSGVWGEPSGATPTTHILKPAIGGMDDHDLNEHLCLEVARGLGLTVARTEMVQFDDERALVVRRYDRVPRDGRVLRVHQEDFCQALSIHPAHKYENEGGPSVADMVKVVRNTEPGDPTRDVGAVCQAVAFNWLILGTDAHAKNYSLLLSGAQVRLAPLYDIASALPYGDHPSKLRLAQKVGGTYRPDIIARRHWERLAAACGTNPDELISDIHTMIDRTPDVLSDTIRNASLTEDEGSAAGKLLDRLSTWLTSCRRSLESGADTTN